MSQLRGEKVENGRSSKDQITARIHTDRKINLIDKTCYKNT